MFELKKTDRGCCSERLFTLLIRLITRLRVNQEMPITSKYEDRECSAGSLPADSELPCFEEMNPALELTLTIGELNVM